MALAAITSSERLRENGKTCLRGVEKNYYFLRLLVILTKFSAAHHQDDRDLIKITTSKGK